MISSSSEWEQRCSGHLGGPLWKAGRQDHSLDATKSDPPADTSLYDNWRAGRDGDRAGDGYKVNMVSACTEGGVASVHYSEASG